MTETIECRQCRIDTWKGCCDVKDLGLAKSIGVSNFGIAHLQQLIESKPKYLPTINQVDLHPFMTRDALVKFCEDHKILLQVRIWVELDLITNALTRLGLHLYEVNDSATQ